MHTVDLTQVGLGIHEGLVAYVADEQDYFAEEGVHVALGDGCAWDTVVNAVLDLESASFVTGEVLHVDGGESAGLA